MRNNVRAVRVRVGANVRQLRRLRNWTQDHLAELVGNSGKYIGEIERGEVNVSLDILTRIAIKLSVDVAVLCRASGPDEGPQSYTITQRDLDQFAQVADIVERVKRSKS